MSLTQEQIQREWEKADSDKSGSLDFKEVVSLLNKLNLKMKEKEIKKRFKEVDADGSKKLDKEEFENFLERLRAREEFIEIFEKKGNSTDGKMTAEQFHKFLTTEQKETVDLDYAKRIIGEYEHKVHATDPTPSYFSVAGFSNYLASSKANTIFEPKRSTVFQDMNRPFAHYFIASSHNTYLLGDQLQGTSSVQAYINAFNLGCKCVELDCWDVPGADGPMIYHGHTLTSKISFKEVIETVRDHGFVKNDYPVVLSLEVHCGEEGQKQMAAILVDVLGKTLMPAQFALTGTLPPPGQLLKKVLLKGKMCSLEKLEEEIESDQEEEEEEEEVPAKNQKKDKKDKKDDKKSETKKDEKKEKKEKKKSQTAKELSDLIHLRSVGFHGFDKYKEQKAWEMSSFVESKVAKFSGSNASDFILYNTKHVSRIYPKGVRVDSSNYDPMPSWTLGAQIVALNYQTASQPMWENVGKFQDNGSSGYILKPDYLINPTNSKMKNEMNVTLTVISAFNLPKVAGKGKEDKGKGEIIDPYVKIYINGVQHDKKTSETKVVKNNGFNPHWNHEVKFSLFKPDLALVTFKVSDSDIISKDDFIGQYSLPVSCLRNGYRTVPLKDHKGTQYTDATLFVHIKIEIPK